MATARNVKFTTLALAATGLLLCGCSGVAPSTEEMVTAALGSGLDAYSVNCATEGGHCSFPGSRPVSYCAFPNGSPTCIWGKIFSEGTDCTNSAFGGDPYPGLTKYCYLGLDGFGARVASEDGWCTTSGRTERFVYGADTRWVEMLSSTGTYCSNSAFGSDPAPGVVKSCYKREESGSDGYTYCASEGSSCSFTGYYNTKVVAYGANGQFVYKTFQNSVACDNSTFGDPAPGYVKACYLRN